MRWGVIVLVVGIGCRPSTGVVEPEARREEASEEVGNSAEKEGAEASGWELVAEVDGILVMARDSEVSALKVFRGVARVEAPLVEVLAVVTDAARHEEWIYSCSDSGLVAQTSESTGVVYNRTKTPWPVPDRDVVLDSRVEVVDGEREVWVRFSATDHPDKPPVEGVVRMPYLVGHYHLWREGEGTRVEYQVDGDPGGSLPAWLATRGTRDMPLETLRELRTQVERTRGSYAARIEEFRRTLLGGS